MISSMIMNNSYGACKVTNKHNYSVTYFLLTATLHNFTLLAMDTRQNKKYILLINPKRKKSLITVTTSHTSVLWCQYG